jgi:hypothetical protein
MLSHWTHMLFNTDKSCLDAKKAAMSNSVGIDWLQGMIVLPYYWILVHTHYPV